MAGCDDVRKVRIVANPAAGQDEPVLATLNKAFADTGVDWDVSVTQGSGDAARLARAFAEEGVPIVASYGGDGTVAEVASALVGTGSVLGLLPGGTANVFAWELGVPSDLEQAARLLCEGGTVRNVDIGTVGEERFVLRVGIGYEADAALGATREMKDRLGKAAYVVEGLRELGSTEVSRYRLELDGEVAEAEGFTCMVVNAGSLGVGALTVSSQVKVDDGLLDVMVLADPGIDSAIATVGKVLAGKEIADFHRQARRVRVEADPDRPVVRDGEPTGTTPVDVSVLPGALRVLVPAGSVG